MKKKLFLLFIGCVSLLTIIVFVRDTMPIEWKIQKKITEKDNTFKELIYMETNHPDPFIYAFYTNKSYVDYSIGIALLEKNESLKTHIMGSTPIHSDTGFTYNTGESDQLSAYILYGTYTNPLISQIKVNKDQARSVKINDFYLWYYIFDEPYSSTYIKVINRSNDIIFEKEIYR